MAAEILANIENVVISRNDAQKHGLTYYFTGLACKNGNTALRQTSNCTCKCEVCSDRQRRSHADWKRNNPIKVKLSRDVCNALPESRAAIAEWSKKNKGRRNAITARRHAKKIQATPMWSDAAEVAEVYRQAALRGWHVDHVVPLSSDIVCGLHCVANLQVLCASENCSKGNHHWPDMP